MRAHGVCCVCVCVRRLSLATNSRHSYIDWVHTCCIHSCESSSISMVAAYLFGRTILICPEWIWLQCWTEQTCTHFINSMRDSNRDQSGIDVLMRSEGKLRAILFFILQIDSIVVRDERTEWTDNVEILLIQIIIVADRIIVSFCSDVVMNEYKK